MQQRQVGSFLLEEELGRGGMSVVHRARAVDGSAVAVKLLFEADAPTLAAFARERRLQAQLSSEAGFVPLLDAGVERGQPWLAMPLLEGGSLRDRLKRGPLPRDEALALVGQLARALARAHALGIVHRDLKPENVLFDRAGRPFVADLGLAKHFLVGAPGASQSVGLTRTGQGMGTPGYMAPEQVDDARAVGPTADVFALGALLFECLSGERPFPARSLLQLVEAFERGAPTLASRGVRDAPGVEALLRRCLAQAPEARYPHAGALAAALETEAAAPAAGPPPSSRRGALVALGVLVLGASLAGAIAVRARTARTVAWGPEPGGGPASLATAAPMGPPTLPAWTRPVADPRSGGKLELLGAWTALPRHGSVVFFLAVRPDGRLALSASADSSVLVWDLEGPAVAARAIRLPVGMPATGLLWDPGDPRLAWVGSTDGRVRLLDVVDERWVLEVPLRQSQDPAEHPWGLAAGPGGELLAAMNDGGLVTWSRGPDGRFEARRSLAHEGPVYCVGVGPGGRMFTCGEDGYYREWERPGRLQREWKLRSSTLTSAVHLRSGQVALSGQQGLFLLDREGGTSKRVPGHGGRVNFLGLDATRQRLFSVGFDGNLGVLREGAQEVQRLARSDERLNALALTPDGETLLVGGMDGTVAALGAEDAALRPARAAHAGAVTALALMGDQVLSAGSDGTLRWWDRQGQERASATGEHTKGNGFGYPRFPPWTQVALLSELEAVGLGTDGLTRRVAADGPTARVNTSEAPSLAALAVSPQGVTGGISADGKSAFIEGSPGRTLDLPAPAGARWTALAWGAGEVLLLGDDRGEIHKAGAAVGLAVEPTDPAKLSAITCLTRVDEGLAAGTASGQLLLQRFGFTVSAVTQCGNGPVRAVTAGSGRFLATLDPLPPTGQAQSVTVWDAAQPGRLAVHDRLLFPPGEDEPTCLLYTDPRELLVGTRAGRLLRYRVSE